MKKLIHLCLVLSGLLFANRATAQSEATFYTSMGSFTVDLTDTLTPITVDSFIARVSEKFYDGLTFHRVIDKFMIQGGDPAGDGTGGPGYTIPDEFHSTLTNKTRTLAMANAGPNTGGCQFYINLVNNSHLNNKHTVFGTVTQNFTVVQSIGKVPTGANDRPVTDVVIDSIRITRFPAAIKDQGGNSSITVYPNPGTGIFNLDLPSIETRIDVTDMRGRIVISVTAAGPAKIDLSDFPAGLYAIKLSNQQGVFSGRLVKQ